MMKTPALVVALSLLLTGATPAFADTTSIAHEHDDDKNFPMAAADFRAHVTRRETHLREHVEKFITEKGVAKDKADALRATLNAGIAKIDKRVDEVAADGTVTKDEAATVHALIKNLRHDVFGDEHR